MKFFLVTDSGELKVVVAERYHPCSSPQNYDFHDEGGGYAGYYNVPNDVDVNPVEAVKKAQRRIDRTTAALRRDIKDFHQRLKEKAAAHVMLGTKDVSNVPFLPTYEEQEAARKATEDAKRLEKQKSRKAQPSDDGWDTFAPIGLHDFLDPVASSHGIAMEVTRYIQSAAETAQRQARAASGSAPRRIRRPTPQPQYRGVLSQDGGTITQAPGNDQIPAAAIHDAVEAMDQSAILAAPDYGFTIDFNIPLEAASWPTRSPDTTQLAQQQALAAETPVFQNYRNSWASWLPPTRSSLQSIVRRTS